jgi:hypothetical protein
MINKIRELEKLSRLLEPKASDRKKWNSEVINYSNTFINNLDVSKAFIKSKENSKDIYHLDIEEEAIELTSLLESTKKNIDGVGINPASGGHMGYIPGGGLYPSALGDFIAAVSNRYAGVFYAAPWCCAFRKYAYSMDVSFNGISRKCIW